MGGRWDINWWNTTYLFLFTLFWRIPFKCLSCRRSVIIFSLEIFNHLDIVKVKSGFWIDWKYSMIIMLAVAPRAPSRGCHSSFPPNHSLFPPAVNIVTLFPLCIRYSFIFFSFGHVTHWRRMRWRTVADNRLGPRTCGVGLKGNKGEVLGEIHKPISLLHYWGLYSTINVAMNMQIHSKYKYANACI